jgi:hypothetical protein
MRLHQTKNLLCIKESNYQNEAKAYKVGEIFASYSSDRELIPRICKDIKKLNNPINKWANELNKHFLKEIHIANKYIKKCSCWP